MDPLTKKGNGIIQPTAPAEEPAPVEEELVEIEALYTSPMPEPVRTGLRVWRPRSEALLYVDQGKAKLVTPEHETPPAPPENPAPEQPAPSGANPLTGEPAILSGLPVHEVEP